MSMKEVLRKLLGSSSINEEPKLNKMEILDFKVTGYKENTLYFWKLPECEMTFVAKNGKTYIAYSKFTELTMYLTIRIYNLNDDDNRLIARIDEPDFDKFGIKYERIDVQEDLGNLGIGYALQEMMNRIFFLIAKENDIKFSHIHGVIGTNGKDKPEYSMLLYESFDGKAYDSHKMKLNRVGFNKTDCNLEYFID